MAATLYSDMAARDATRELLHAAQANDKARARAALSNGADGGVVAQCNPSSVINPSSGKLTAHVTALGLAIARDSSELTRLILQNGGAARLETRTLTPLNDVESR